MNVSADPNLSKDRARDVVQAEVAREAASQSDDDRERVRALGRDLHGDVVSEAVSDRHREQRSNAVVRVMQVVNLLFTMLYASIALEFVLELMAARDGNVFKRFLDTITAPFLAPFRTLLPTLAIGASQLIFSYVVALIVFAMLHVGVRKVASMVADAPTGV